MHEVGQIIFLVSRKTQSILAAQVCEQNVKKTLDGEETSFRVRIGGGLNDSEEDSLYNLERIDADIYSSPEEASESLYSAAKSAIDELVDDAADDASKCFGYQRLPAKKTTRSRRKATPKNSSPKASPKKKDEDEEATYVTIPDGTKAKLKTPIEGLE